MVIFVNKYHSAEPVNVVTSHGDCTPMIDKMIQSFAKRSRNTKSEASNDSPLSGLFILPIAHISSFFCWNIPGGFNFYADCLETWPNLDDFTFNLCWNHQQYVLIYFWPSELLHSQGAFLQTRQHRTKHVGSVQKAWVLKCSRFNPGWWQLKYLYVQPDPWGNDAIWRTYFWDGLKLNHQPVNLMTSFPTNGVFGWLMTDMLFDHLASQIDLIKFARDLTNRPGAPKFWSLRFRDITLGNREIYGWWNMISWTRFIVIP